MALTLSNFVKGKGDEDEGSPLQNGVNSFVGFDTPFGLLNQQRKKIDRSAEALRVSHHLFHLSLRT
jgi:hypothetical protein